MLCLANGVNFFDSIMTNLSCVADADDGADDDDDVDVGDDVADDCDDDGGDDGEDAGVDGAWQNGVSFCQKQEKAAFVVVDDAGFDDDDGDNDLRAFCVQCTCLSAECWDL